MSAKTYDVWHHHGPVLHANVLWNSVNGLVDGQIVCFGTRGRVANSTVSQEVVICHFLHEAVRKRLYVTYRGVFRGMYMRICKENILGR